MGAIEEIGQRNVENTVPVEKVVELYNGVEDRTILFEYLEQKIYDLVWVFTIVNKNLK